MKLIDVLRTECVAARVQLQSKAQALEQVARVAKNSPLLKDVDEKQILAGLKEREELGSTGFGQGIAIPHCRLKSVPDFVVGIITAPDGVDFQALDKEKVRLIVFIIAPDAEPNKHIKLLSAISQTLATPCVVDEILAETTAEGVCESFLRHTRADLETRGPTTKSLVSVFVRDENVFRLLLEKLTGIETSSIAVLSTENTAAYLAKVPLFAGFWTDKSSGAGMLIQMLVEKGLVNESIRRIESVVGDISSCEGVAVAVQDLSYAAGSL